MNENASNEDSALLTLWQTNIADIHHIKEVQWTRAYYYILVYVAILLFDEKFIGKIDKSNAATDVGMTKTVAVFSQPTLIIPPEIMVIVWKFILLGFAIYVSWINLNTCFDIQDNLVLYRLRLQALMTKFNGNFENIIKIDTVHDIDYANPKRYFRTIHLAFIILHFGCVVAVAYVLTYHAYPRFFPFFVGVYASGKVIFILIFSCWLGNKSKKYKLRMYEAIKKF